MSESLLNELNTSFSINSGAHWPLSFMAAVRAVNCQVRTHLKCKL